MLQHSWIACGRRGFTSLSTYVTKHRKKDSDQRIKGKLIFGFLLCQEKNKLVALTFFDISLSFKLKEMLSQKDIKTHL